MGANSVTLTGTMCCSHPELSQYVSMQSKERAQERTSEYSHPQTMQIPLLTSAERERSRSVITVFPTQESSQEHTTSEHIYSSGKN